MPTVPTTTSSSPVKASSSPPCRRFLNDRWVPYVYILECHDGSFYVGSSWDLNSRVATHNAGLGSAYTRRRGRRPVRLVWAAGYDRIEDAFVREKQIQGWGRAKRLAHIQGRVDDLRKLSRSKSSNPD